MTSRDESYEACEEDLCAVFYFFFIFFSMVLIVEKKPTWSIHSTNFEDIVILIDLKDRKP